MNEVKSPYMKPRPNGADLISRADAIEAVDGLKERPQKYYTQYNNALSDAVLELTTLPSADAVSRKEYEYKERVIEGVQAIIDNYKKCQDITDTILNRQGDEIKRLKASAEAVQGEWIEKGGELVCSVCGNSVSFSRTPKGWVLGRFCQSCGTRMKGGE